MRLTSHRVRRRKVVVEVSLPGSSRSSPSADDPDPPVAEAKAGRLFPKRTGRSRATLLPHGKCMRCMTAPPLDKTASTVQCFSRAPRPRKGTARPVEAIAIRGKLPFNVPHERSKNSALMNCALPNEGALVEQR